MMHDKNGKDGIANDLFPLTYHRQLKYDFKLVKEETYQGSKVYRVRFEPKQKPKLGDLDDGGAIWKGEALIDAEEYQPIRVSTEMAWKMPLRRQDAAGHQPPRGGVHGDVSEIRGRPLVPGELRRRVRVARRVLLSSDDDVNMTNSDFRRTDVTSNIAYAIDDDK